MYASIFVQAVKKHQVELKEWQFRKAKCPSTVSYMTVFMILVWPAPICNTESNSYAGLAKKAAVP